MSRIGNIALVMGRGMAGLAAAAALARHFEQVVIIEKDLISNKVEARPGVGQGNHVHSLMKGGEQSIERLLPGTTKELLARGGIEVRSSIDTCFYQQGDWLPRRDLGFCNISASRALIEDTVFQRLLCDPVVSIRDNTSVEDITYDGNGRVCGVSVRTPGKPAENLSADVVVDCTGSLSRVRESLAAHGYDAPQEFKINIGMTYASAIVEIPEDFSVGYKILGVSARPPKKRGGIVSVIEGGQWLVSLVTRFENRMPVSYEEMLAFARDIEVPDIADFLSRAKITTPLRNYRKPDATWRRFDKVRCFPEGLLVLGDAIASFNPVYGQGMSTAWLQACALDDVLNQRAISQDGLDGFANDYFQLAMQICRNAWNSSTLIDAAYEEVTGDIQPGSEQGILIQRALRTLLADDPELHADFIGVGQMTTPISTLMRTDRVQRIMAAVAKLHQ